MILESPRIPASQAAWRGPVLLLLIAGLLFGVPLVALVPPFQVPDEPQHFYRAFALAEGQPFARETAVGGGSRLPQSLPVVVALTLPQPPQKGKLDGAAFRAALDVELESSRRIEVSHPGSAVYFPHLYLPQALGIALGRLFGAGPLMLLYLGRLFGLFGCLALAVAAVRVMPVQRWTLAALSLTPMTLYLRSAVTADALTIGIVVLAIALFVREALGSGPLARATLAGLALASALAALSKPSYAVVGLCFFVLPPSRFERPLRYASSAFLIVVLPALLSAAWNLHASTLLDLRGVSGYEGIVVDPLEQARAVLERPGKLLAAIGHTLWPPKQVYEICRGVAGYFGWLDTALTNGQIVVLAAGVLALAIVDTSARHGLAAWQKAIAALVFVLGLLAVLTLLFLTVTPPSWRRIGGMQGRYLLPLLPLVVLPLHSRRTWTRAALLERARPILALLLATLSGGLTLATVIRRFL